MKSYLLSETMTTSAQYTAEEVRNIAKLINHDDCGMKESDFNSFDEYADCVLKCWAETDEWRAQFNTESDFGSFEVTVING